MTAMTLLNESSFDRTLRIVIGSIAIALALVGPRTAWGWLGAIPLATGVIGFCPLYRVLGIKTGAPPAERGGCCS